MNIRIDPKLVLAIGIMIPMVMVTSRNLGYFPASPPRAALSEPIKTKDIPFNKGIHGVKGPHSYWYRGF